jgi:hypothetical protein
MPQGVAGSPEFGYDIGHKYTFLWQDQQDELDFIHFLLFII